MKPTASTLPTGTVTFLFTDIEGSTRLAMEHGDNWEAIRQRRLTAFGADFLRAYASDGGRAL